MNALALALMSSLALAAHLPAAAPREVIRSTAPTAAQPSDIPALKRRIEDDQREVRRTRAAVKKALKGKNEPAKVLARQKWLAAKERLKADRALLRRVIETREAEHREDAKARGARGPGEKPRP